VTVLDWRTPDLEALNAKPGTPIPSVTTLDMTATHSLPQTSLANQAPTTTFDNHLVGASKLALTNLDNVRLNPIGGSAFLEANWQAPLGYQVQNPAPELVPAQALAGIAKPDPAAWHRAAECANTVDIADPREVGRLLYKN
jgi:hypothetical protein